MIGTKIFKGRLLIGTFGDLSLQEIGWKNKEDARRVVVLTTDAAYHFAGDGLVRVTH